MENIEMLYTVDNSMLLKEYKAKYPTLNEVFYEDGKLIFPEGSIIISDLSTIPETVFTMQRENIYLYLSNKYYEHDNSITDAQINYIFSLFSKFELSAEEQLYLKRFTYDFWLRLKLYYGEPILEHNSEFVFELLNRQKVITESYNSSTKAANIIKTIYNQKVSQDNANNIEETSSQTEGKVISLNRSKQGIPKLLDDEFLRLNAAGFTRIVLILAVTVVIGIYLGWILLK